MPYLVTHFINGQLLKSTGRKQPIYDPVTGDIQGEVLMADAAMTDQAVMAAERAFPAWANTPPSKRARLLQKFKILLEKNIDDLASIITKEHGKTRSDARGSLQRGIDVLEYATGIPGLLKGNYTADVATNIDSYFIRQP